MSEFVGSVHTFLRDDTINAKALCQDQRISLDGQLGPHWTQGESLRFTTSLRAGDELKISIREFRPTPTPSHPVVESFHVPYYDAEFSFSPVSSHASFLTETKIIILNVRDSNILLHTETTQGSYCCPSGVFSPDGCFFACRALYRDIHVWKNTPTGYIPWSTFRPRIICDNLSFSPASTSILTRGPDGIQLSRPDNLASPPAASEAEPRLALGSHLVTSSTVGTWIATARIGGHTITILDSPSGSPRHSIDTGFKIHDIKLVHDSILVLGIRKLAKWDIEPDGARKVDGEILHPMGHYRLILSGDGARIAGVGENILMYDVKSQQLIRRCKAPRYGAYGVRFSHCGSKLCFWPVSYLTKPGDLSGYFTEVEIDGEQFANTAVQVLPDGWSFFACLPSRDGFRIGRGGRWVEDSRGRKLLWLPPNWKVRYPQDAVWEGNLLALVDCRHKEPIVIQVEP